MYFILDHEAITYICSDGQEEESDKYQKKVQSNTSIPLDTSLLPESRSMLRLPQSNVSPAPEDESEEAVEQTAHQTKKV